MLVEVSTDNLALLVRILKIANDLWPRKHFGLLHSKEIGFKKKMAFDSPNFIFITTYFSLSNIYAYWWWLL